ncbi:hypothetical protein B0H12DRAFT_375701 [Mycena haematopus]|nr:hypothetical protein B0H12DRAFT_375701 [Mycena haematopus]
MVGKGATRYGRIRLTESDLLAWLTVVYIPELSVAQHSNSTYPPRTSVFIRRFTYLCSGGRWHDCSSSATSSTPATSDLPHYQDNHLNEIQLSAVLIYPSRHCWMHCILRFSGRWSINNLKIDSMDCSVSPGLRVRLHMAVTISTPLVQRRLIAAAPTSSVSCTHGAELGTNSPIAL